MNSCQRRGGTSNLGGYFHFTKRPPLDCTQQGSGHGPLPGFAN